MRTLVLASIFSGVAAQAQPPLQLQWQHRFPEPAVFTGFGDKGLGMDVRNDSLVVGHSLGNLSQCSLFSAEAGLMQWTQSTEDTVYHQGGRSYFGNALIGAERVASGNGISLRTRLYGLDGTVLWSADGGLQQVNRMQGPLVNTAGDTAWVLAYASGNLHGFGFDHNGSTDTWQSAVGHPWTGFSACLNAAGHPLVTAMVDHPDAFADVPRLLLLNNGDGTVAWSTYLEDTTGFVVDAPAITVPWAGDTILSIHTTYAGKVRMRMTDGNTGQTLWNFTDSLGYTPYLVSVAVVPSLGSILVALDGGTVIAYTKDQGRIWSDSLHAVVHYPELKVLANETHVALVVPVDRHLGLGQDLLVRSLDPASGAVLGEAWVNDTVDTHDILEGAVLNGDLLHVLSASTYDTLSILNERTTLMISTFDLSGTAQVSDLPIHGARVRGVITTGIIRSYLDPQVRTWTAFDLLGHVLARGDRDRMDAWYTSTASGMYAVLGGEVRLAFIKP
jgi:hypothetical protein